MKRTTAFLIAVLILIPMFSSCAQTDNPGNKDETLKIVCTIFPQYDWVSQVLGDRADDVDLTLLIAGGVDLHNYQPSVDDIITISICDLFIYVGGESDKWVGDALREAVNPNMAVITLLDLLGNAAKIEELLEGMENGEHYHAHDEEHGHAHNHDDEHAHEHDDEHSHDDNELDGEYDEHVWLSLRNATAFCVAIADALSTLDADNADTYRSNATAYIEKLSALDARYEAAVARSDSRTLLFGDRFPFRYLADDYDIRCYAAFPGCSAETEAGFGTIVFLSEKVDELNLNCIMVTESSDRAIAETIADNTANKDQRILVMDAMQSVTQDDIRNGTTYLSVMESNLDVLKEALK